MRNHVRDHICNNLGAKVNKLLVHRAFSTTVNSIKKLHIEKETMNKILIQQSQYIQLVCSI